MAYRMPGAERRARLGVRHALAPSARAVDPVGAARSVVALHSTDPSSVYVSAWARTRDAHADVASVQRALYEDRALIRLPAMRRTVFVTPVARLGDVRLTARTRGRTWLEEELAAGAD
ncbi:DNA glycosylase AlkZ-like family protein [Streptomyces sp. NPDC058373]|uniref:DNA glycosylase AlkZ-like family protein n=1 Tax=Streptomyces sp. NPDC058373 TaxID=3346465 RepID=UPI0036497A73